MLTHTEHRLSPEPELRRQNQLAMKSNNYSPEPHRITKPPPKLSTSEAAVQNFIRLNHQKETVTGVAKLLAAGATRCCV